MDVAPLIGAFGANAIAEVASEELLDRGMYHRASLPLQAAAAAELVGHHALRDHALGNFSRRVTSQTLYDPEGLANTGVAPPGTL